jgi:hypothetical protein
MKKPAEGSKKAQADLQDDGQPQRYKKNGKQKQTT